MQKTQWKFSAFCILSTSLLLSVLGSPITCMYILLVNIWPLDKGLTVNYLSKLVGPSLNPIWISNRSWSKIKTLFASDLDKKNTAFYEVMHWAPDNVHTFIPIMPISSPNSMFDYLLESSHRNESNKWSNRNWWRKNTSRVDWGKFYAHHQVHLVIPLTSHYKCHSCRNWCSHRIGEKVREIKSINNLEKY